MKKIFFIVFLFTLFFAPAAFAAKYQAVAYKGNVAKDSANVYGSKKNWTQLSFTCGNQTIYLSKNVNKAINKWRSRGYTVKIFKIVKGKYINLCRIK